VHVLVHILPEKLNGLRSLGNNEMPTLYIIPGMSMVAIGLCKNLSKENIASRHASHVTEFKGRREE
jgi:hypothetical protein